MVVGKIDLESRRKRRAELAPPFSSICSFLFIFVQLSCSGNRFLTKSRLMCATELEKGVRFAISETRAPMGCLPKRHATGKNAEKLINARLDVK
jgi:hypothetical protein